MDSSQLVLIGIIAALASLVGAFAGVFLGSVQQRRWVTRQINQRFDEQEAIQAHNQPPLWTDRQASETTDFAVAQRAVSVVNEAFPGLDFNQAEQRAHTLVSWMVEQDPHHENLSRAQLVEQVVEMYPEPNRDAMRKMPITDEDDREDVPTRHDRIRDED